MSVKIVYPKGMNNLESVTQIEKVINEFSFPEHIQTIAVWNAHHGRVPVEALIDSDADFWVCFWAAPEGDEFRVNSGLYYSTVCGKELAANQRDGLTIGYNSAQVANFYPIQDEVIDSLLSPIAFQWHNTVLIPYDLPHGRNHIQHILRYILSKIQWDKIQAYVPPPLSEAFLSWWQSYAQAQSTGLSDLSIRDIKETLARYQRSVDDYQRQLKQDELLKGSREKIIQQIALRNQSELELIRACPKVSQVHVATGERALVITTEPLEFIGPAKEMRSLGSLQILLEKAVPGKNSIRIRKTGGDSSSCHPHVGSSGNACFGNIRELIETLLAQGELAALVMTILQYLQSSTDGTDTYYTVGNFPLVIKPEPLTEGVNDEQTAEAQMVEIRSTTSPATTGVHFSIGDGETISYGENIAF